MDLHRTGKRPDWLKRPRREYSWFQKVAQRSGGIFTPGNVITLVGFLTTLYGLYLLLERRFGAATGLILFGRLCDIADGWVADRTNTKSPIGELLDATCDKIVTIVGLIVFGVTGLAPWWIVAVVVTPQMSISMVSAFALHQNRRLHPSSTGKISMTLAGFGFGGLLVAAWANSPGWDSVALCIGYTCLAGSVGLSSLALVRYVQQYREARHI